MSGPTPTPATSIVQLSIDRFRGIRSLVWRPANGLNIILGGGDVGKTTILEAIGLLLSPVNPANLLDTEFNERDIQAGFSIEAVIRLPQPSGISTQLKASWPWLWNGSEALVPTMDASVATAGEPAYKARVRGTEDLELVYEIIQPNGSIDNFPVALRRAIGLVRLSGDDRNDRDLRLVQGSALDRLLSDKGLRSRISRELADNDIESELTEAAQKALSALDTSFEEQGLPSGLDLAITGGQGASIASLIGLTASHGTTELPLASWGAGTRRLSALAIAEQNQGEAPITIVDEAERGLEPYRQRILVEKLQNGGSQSFVTTHSPSVLSAASKAGIWHVDHAGTIGPLDGSKIERHRRSDPETFLARLAIIAEGATEVGFATAILERALGSPLEISGIHVSDGHGHETTLGLLEALAAGGLRFGGLVDNEGKYPERWKKLEHQFGSLLFRWPSGCIEKNVILAAPDDQLEALITDGLAQKTGMRLRTLAERLGIEDKSFASIRTKAGTGLHALIVDAATGAVPPDKEDRKKEYQSHAGTWFKSVEGGRELESKVFALGLWGKFRALLLPFCNSVRGSVGLAPVADIA